MTGAQRRFDEWRQERQRRTRIPEPLWAAAMTAAREHGIWRTSRQLRVDCYTPKQRLAAAKNRVAGKPVRFVEVTPRVVSPGPACVLEIGDAEGRRLRVELREAAGAEEIARALWSHRR
jgi:hypothetical protein